jgi:hypothetical protein
VSCIGYDTRRLACQALQELLQFKLTHYLHAALLDIHLAGEPVFPVADVLAERGVPFAFVTGYGKDELPPVYRDRPLLQKPFRPRAVLAMIEMMIALPNHRE